MTTKTLITGAPLLDPKLEGMLSKNSHPTNPEFMSNIKYISDTKNIGMEEALALVFRSEYTLRPFLCAYYDIIITLGGNVSELFTARDIRADWRKDSKMNVFLEEATGSKITKQSLLGSISRLLLGDDSVNFNLDLQSVAKGGTHYLITNNLGWSIGTRELNREIKDSNNPTNPTVIVKNQGSSKINYKKYYKGATSALETNFSEVVIEGNDLLEEVLSEIIQENIDKKKEKDKTKTPTTIIAAELNAVDEELIKKGAEPVGHGFSAGRMVTTYGNALLGGFNFTELFFELGHIYPKSDEIGYKEKRGETLYGVNNGNNLNLESANENRRRGTDKTKEAPNKGSYILKLIRKQDEYCGSEMNNIFKSFVAWYESFLKIDWNKEDIDYTEFYSTRKEFLKLYNNITT